MNFSIVSKTMDFIPAHIIGSNGQPLSYVKPTYAIYDDPDLDVLLVPGGPASRVMSKDADIIVYIQRTYPKLKYMLSVCTGSQVLAKAGILNGKKATTNKFSWNEIVSASPEVKWVPHARWTVDGNIWTSSGVTAGIDMAHAFTKEIYGNETLANRSANVIEIEIHEDPSWDPFCEIWDLNCIATNVQTTAGNSSTDVQKLISIES